MNLLAGEIVRDAAATQQVLDTLPERIVSALSKPPLAAETVVAACEKLLDALDDAPLLAVMAQLGIGEALGRLYLAQARLMFSRPYLERRLAAELGPDYGRPRLYTPYGNAAPVREQWLPLGVLLHIAAGNADGLPAFSVLEGLLTGNINILKLPVADQGLSVGILHRLISVEPRLADYIYVFDYSSKDQRAISKLIEVADAVVVWGGDQAVEALRRLVPPEVRLIEWGHKLSFAYVTPAGIADQALLEVARNICRTDQLLCSSCQGLFLDSSDLEQVHDLARRFLPLLEQAAGELARPETLGLTAQLSLELYHQELESAYTGSRLYRGKGVSVTAYPDQELALSLQFRNCWVRPLPRGELLQALRPYKNHLQTVALLCGAGEREQLGLLLSRTGLTRLTGGETMSATYCGAAHDGEYPLRRYLKIFSQE